jgi:RHS repeat-associated protein
MKLPRSRGRALAPLFKVSSLRWSAFVLVVVLGIALAPGSASGSGPTNVSGTISANTTWTLANSPYVMTGDVTVASGVTLTIEPGVVVQGNNSARKLNVNGSLSAVGTAAQPITFTSTSDSAAGQWNGISFPSGAGNSTLDYANVRYGGDSAASAANGMVSVSGGTITIDHSSFTSSKVSGLAASGGSTGAGLALTIRHSKFENNGFNGATKQGHGLYSFNARVVVEDSAFWSNAIDGLNVTVGGSYSQAKSLISGSSIYGNKRFGVYMFQDPGFEALAPDGNVAGKPGNDVYDNGTFGFSVNEKWEQISILRSSLSVDWRGTYWGPVSYVPCTVGSQNGQLSYGAPDPDPTTNFPLPRGPVPHTFDYSGSGNNIVWCGNDKLLDNPPAYQQPDLYFDPPPPTFGGLLKEQTYGDCSCQQRDSQNALSLDQEGLSPLAYTPWPVNTASGSLTETATDLRLAGPGIPFAWTRSYNSGDTSSGGLGRGWAHPFEATLTVSNPTTGELDYHAGSGQHTRFTKTSGGSSGAANYAAKGFDGRLKRLADSSYQLTTRDQRVFSFDSSGNLTQIKPRFLPATTLAYTSGKLSSITDSAGRTVTISYSVSDPSLIEKVTLPDGRYVQYGYTSGRLTSVQDARAKTWTLAYDANGRLTSIQDPLGHYQLQNVAYDGQGRVTSEQNGAGDAIGYAYTTSSPYDVTTVTIPGRGDWVYKHIGYLLMSVTNPLGKTTSYTYDPMARRASVTDARGYTRRFEYDAYGNLVKEIAPASLGAVSRTFNGTNDLLTEKDGRGNTTSYAYATGSDPAADYQVGQLKTLTDRENGVSTFKYWTTTSSPAPPATNVGLPKSLTNQRQKTTTYDYDSAGNLSKVTSPLGLKTTMSYDGSGRLTSRRDPRGNVPVPPAGYLTQWGYDNVDHVTQLTDARNNVTDFAFYDNELPWKVTRYESDGTPRVTSFEYDNANRLWKTTKPRGGIETRLYWPDGQLKSLDSPEHRQTSYDYDAAGQLHTLVEPNGNAAGATPSDWTWTYGYDDAGNRTSAAHPDGGTSSIHYDPLNRPDQWTDPLTHVTSVSYDENGNVTTSTDGLNHSKSFTYDKLDRLSTAKDERLKTWTYAYFPTGELKSVTSPLGNKTTYDLDNDGRTSSMVEPRGNVSGGTPADYTWAYAYDEVGNLTRVTDPLGNHVDYGYDAVNELSQLTDQRGNATAFTYDAMNRLWKVTPPAAGGNGTLDTVYGYDADGNLASRTDPNDHVTSWTYDLDGLRTQRTTPVGSWNSTYDANGNLTTLETPAGISTPTTGDGTISYAYDRMSRLTGVDYSDSTLDVSRSYDLAGRPQTMGDGSGTVTYTYDNSNRLTDIARSGGGAGLNGTLHYDYDNAGNITGRTYPDGAGVSQSFDDDGNLTSFTSGTQTTSFVYDAAGNLTTTSLPSANGYVETRSFDRAGRLTGVDNAKAGTSLSNFLWTLDPAGNPTKAQTTRGGGDSYDAYEYDTRNRLSASCFGVSSGASNCSGASNLITYAYDKVSNRSQEVRSGSVANTGTIDYAYNAADQLTSTTKGGTSTTYTSDANGNQASVGSRSFSYNLAGELASTTSSGTTTSYGYDGDGRRLSSSTSGGAELRYSWDLLADSGIPQLALERDTSGNLVRRYLNGPLGAVSFTSSSDTYSYLHDPLGNVTDVTNASGSPQWRYEYEAYGGERSATDVSGSAPPNPLRFEGQYLDAETSLYHLRARQYDPATGRFGALDPVESPPAQPYDAAYLYVDARPTTLADPLGLCSFCDWLSDKADDAGGWAEQKVSGPVGLADDALQTYVDPLLRKVVTPVSGFGDAASLGLTNSIRTWMGTNDVVDKCSGWYTGGSVVGYAATAVAGVGLAGRAAELSVNLRYYPNARGIGLNMIKGSGKPATGGWRLGFDWHRFKAGGRIINRPHIDARGVPRLRDLRHWPW